MQARFLAKTLEKNPISFSKLPARSPFFLFLVDAAERKLGCILYRFDQPICKARKEYIDHGKASTARRTFNDLMQSEFILSPP